MFRTTSRTLLILALGMTQTSLTPASAADVTNLRSGRINTLGAIRRSNPGALLGAYKRQIPSPSTHRSPTIPIPPPSRGQVNGSNTRPTVRIPGRLRSRIVNGIRRLKSVSPPRRTTGTHNRLSDRIRKLKSVGSGRTTGRTTRVLRNMVTTTPTPTRATSSNPSMDHLIGKAGKKDTLQEKIAAKIAARARAAKEAGAKDDKKGNVTINPSIANAAKDPAQTATEKITGDDGNQVKIVTDTQQVLNPKVKGGDKPSIVTTATQRHDGTIRTDGAPRAQSGEKNLGNNNSDSLPYDEFRERGVATPNASGMPVLTTVPGLAFSNLDAIKENAGGFDTSAAEALEPGGAGALKIIPGWLGTGPTLTMPDGSEITTPEGVPSEFEPDTEGLREPGSNGHKGNQPGHVSVLGSGASAALSSGKGSRPSMGDNRTMQDEDTPDEGGNASDENASDENASDELVFTEAEQDASNASIAEENLTDREYYLDGSSNDYTYGGTGFVKVESYDSSGQKTQTTFVWAPGVWSSRRESPCMGAFGPEECVGIVTTNPEAVARAIRGDWVKQGNPEESTGGVMMVNGRPIGQWRSGTPYIRGGVDCRMARCDDTVAQVGAGSSIWTPFNIDSQVVNPAREP